MLKLMNMNYILTFGSVHRVLKAEGILNDANLPFRLIPAPKALEKLCDLVIMVDEGGLAAANAALKTAEFLPKAVYKAQGDDYVKV